MAEKTTSLHSLTRHTWLSTAAAGVTIFFLWREPMYEGMVPGSAFAALAIEHTWALALVNALYQAGVDVALNFRLPAPIVDEAFASLAA